MAVAQKNVFNKKASLLNRCLVSTLFLTFTGWLALVLVAFFVWATEGFEKATQAIHRLRFQPVEQAELLHLSLFQDLREELSADVRQKTASLADKASVLTKSAVTELQGFMKGDAQAEKELYKAGFFAAQVWTLSKAAAQVIGVKLVILASALPLFLLSAAAGLVDGLSQRAIRTASLGRESTYVFHKSLPLVRRIVVLILALWLALPMALAPSPIFVGLSVLLGLVISMSANRFKKYL